VVVVLLAGPFVLGLWKHHSRIWAILNAFIGLLLLLAIWRDRIFPDHEKRREARRARVGTKFEKLFADREAFEKSWERRIKITVAILLPVWIFLAVACWWTPFKILAILPALFALVFLIGLFAQLTPMSDEKFEAEMAKAKTRNAQVEARRAKFAARRAMRAERREERKKEQGPSRPTAANFYSFVYWSVLLCVFGLQDRSQLERPDLVFCAIPAWYLIRALYFQIRQHKHPRGPDASLLSDSSTG
jgi:hypothetical protein